jgi:cellulose biosynthesis protein BcsQ
LLVKYNAKDDLNRIVGFLIDRSGKINNIKLFNTRIRESVLICEAQGLQKNIFEHAPRSRACLDYKLFTDEVLVDIQDVIFSKAAI